MQEYLSLRQRYWEKSLWSIGYGAWSTGNVTQEMINEYISK